MQLRAFLTFSFGWKFSKAGDDDDGDDGDDEDDDNEDDEDDDYKDGEKEEDKDGVAITYKCCLWWWWFMILLTLRQMFSYNDIFSGKTRWLAVLRNCININACEQQNWIFAKWKQQCPHI